MVSKTALMDLNMHPYSNRKNESPGNGSFAKPFVGCVTENVNVDVPLVSAHVNGHSENAGPETVNSEVEYIESQNLSDVKDVDTILKTLQVRLDSKDWVAVYNALNDVRRLSIFHKQSMLDMLGEVIPLVVKSLKNPRSVVCKTAIMTAADLFSAYNDLIIDSLDPLFVQLLLKSSQDKRFVCEAAEKALVAMTAWVSPRL